MTWLLQPGATSEQETLGHAHPLHAAERKNRSLCRSSYTVSAPSGETTVEGLVLNITYEHWQRCEAHTHTGGTHTNTRQVCQIQWASNHGKKTCLQFLVCILSPICYLLQKHSGRN